MDDLKEEGIIRCKKLELVDDKGSIRADIVVEGNEPCFSLYDQQGHKRVEISIYDNNPMIGIIDAFKKANVSLAVN